MLEIIGSFTFLLVLGIAAIIFMIIALEKEMEGWATFALSITLGVVLWQNWYTIADYVSTNFTESILFSLGYIVVGIVWSFIKWNEKIKAVFRTFKMYKNTFTIKHGSITEENRALFIDSIDYKFKDHYGHSIGIGKKTTIEEIGEKITPIGLNYKSLIISWISYWPLSVIGTLLNNPFRRLFEWIYDSLSGFYDNIANKHKNEAFKGLN